MPSFVVEKVVEALNSKSKSVRGSKILVLGVAYKKNVDDMRESPAIEIIEKLHQMGANISYSDPHVPVFDLDAHSNTNLPLRSLELTKATLRNHDCTVLVTDHKLFDYPTIASYANLIVDTRGVLRKFNSEVFQA
jgi:UDP-N-acetyl-D-glucosamine dehydrogenase